MTRSEAIEMLEEACPEAIDDLVREKLELEWCDSCEEFVMTDSEFISGRKGHIDNWMPDETAVWCVHCRQRFD